jgi:hypothetical protein
VPTRACQVREYEGPWWREDLTTGGCRCGLAGVFRLLKSPVAGGGGDFFLRFCETLAARTLRVTADHGPSLRSRDRARPSPRDSLAMLYLHARHTHQFAIALVALLTWHSSAEGATSGWLRPAASTSSGDRDSMGLREAISRLRGAHGGDSEAHEGEVVLAARSRRSSSSPKASRPQKAPRPQKAARPPRPAHSVGQSRSASTSKSASTSRPHSASTRAHATLHSHNTGSVASSENAAPKRSLVNHAKDKLLHGEAKAAHNYRTQRLTDNDVPKTPETSRPFKDRLRPANQQKYDNQGRYKPTEGEKAAIHHFNNRLANDPNFTHKNSPELGQAFQHGTRNGELGNHVIYTGQGAPPNAGGNATVPFPSSVHVRADSNHHSHPRRGLAGTEPPSAADHENARQVYVGHKQTSFVHDVEAGKTYYIDPKSTTPRYREVDMESQARPDPPRRTTPVADHVGHHPETGHQPTDPDNTKPLPSMVQTGGHGVTIPRAPLP